MVAPGSKDEDQADVFVAEDLSNRRARSAGTVQPVAAVPSYATVSRSPLSPPQSHTFKLAKQPSTTVGCDVAAQTDLEFAGSAVNAEATAESSWYRQFIYANAYHHRLTPATTNSCTQSPALPTSSIPPTHLLKPEYLLQ